MNGMHRVSGARTMPLDCEMQGMHGNTSTTKTQKVDAVDAVQSTKAAKLPGDTKVSNDTSANKIDVKI